MLQWYSDWSFSTSKETRPQTSATSKLYEKGKYFTSISNHSQPLPAKLSWTEITANITNTIN